MKTKYGYYLVDANKYSPTTLQTLIEHHHVEYTHLGYIIREELCSYEYLEGTTPVIKVDTGIELYVLNEIECTKDKVKQLIEKANKLIAEANVMIDNMEKGA